MMFSNMTQKHSQQKQKNKQVGLHQTKKLQYVKRNNRVKGKPWKGEKIFLNSTSEKTLVSKIYKELNKIKNA
jgi:hypothetical protein